MNLKIAPTAARLTSPAIPLQDFYRDARRIGEEAADADVLAGSYLCSPLIGLRQECMLLLTGKELEEP